MGFRIKMFIFVNMIGIYSITCLANNKIYIGSSINIINRFKAHKTALNKNKHNNIYLQRSFNKYGLENFKFEILEECNKENILEKENYYMNLYNTLLSNKGYNQVIAQRQDNLYSNIQYLNKLSKAKKGIIPLNYKEARKKLERPVLEYENGIFVKEYSSAKKCAEYLGLNKNSINNFLRGVSKKNKLFPNKIWKYKDGLPVRKIKYNSKSNWNKGIFKKVYIFDKNKNLKTTYNNILETCNNLNMCKNSIMNYCSNKKICKKLNIYIRYEKDILLGP